MARILIVTGEASGDLHGANLAKALKARDPHVSLSGIGGRAMKTAGVELIEEMGKFDVIGMVGPLALIPIIRRFVKMRRLFRSKRWDTVVFIDHPGLNLRFAYFAKAAGLRVIYYVAPQIWAWGPWRIRWIKQRVDHVVVILPFEKPLYDDAGVPCTFVGHPILDAVAPCYDRTALRARFGFADHERVIALLPGSRAHEVSVLLPILIETAEKLTRRDPKTKFILAQASTLHDNLLQPLLESSPVPITVVKEQANEVMAVSDLILVASGTATLQAAVVGTPARSMLSLMAKGMPYSGNSAGSLSCSATTYFWISSSDSLCIHTRCGSSPIRARISCTTASGCRLPARYCWRRVVMSSGRLMPSLPE